MNSEALWYGHLEWDINKFSHLNPLSLSKHSCVSMTPNAPILIVDPMYYPNTNNYHLCHNAYAKGGWIKIEKATLILMLTFECVNWNLNK